MKIGIVVLHYKTIQNTINCLKSFDIQSRSGNEIFGMVVDNGSNDESVGIIKKYLSHSRYFNLHILKENTVFSKAMNSGIEMINNHFGKPDFIVLSNNDVIVKESNLFFKIVSSFEKNQFAVMGPDIYSISTASFSNPIAKRPNYGLTYNLLSIIKSDYMVLLKKWRKKVSNVEISNVEHTTPKSGCLLHGAFLVFSRLYLDIFPFGLYPQNSFYMEENILYFLCLKYGLKTYYEPNICIDHIHSATIEKLFDNDVKRKNKFVVLQQRKSKKVLFLLILRSRLRLSII